MENKNQKNKIGGNKNKLRDVIQEESVPVVVSAVSSSKVASAVVFSGNRVLSIKEASVDSLCAAIMKAKNVVLPKQFDMHYIDRTALPYPCFPSQALAELNRRDLTGPTSNFKMTAQNISCTHAMVFDLNKDVEVILESTKKIVPLQTYGGYMVEKNDEETKKKISSTILADAFMFALVNSAVVETSTTKKIVRADIDYEVAESLKFPVCNLQGQDFVEDKRENIVAGTAEKIAMDSKFAKQVESQFPKQSIQDPKTGKTSLSSMVYDFKKACFLFHRGKPKQVKNASNLHRLTAMCRKVRGSDTGPRHEVHSGYYFGASGRHLYSTGFTVLDIMALGVSCKTKKLEIGFVDSIVSSHVLQSLVANGWLIRIVGSSAYPKYDKQETGIFSYFSFGDIYLRYCPLKDPSPTVVSNDVRIGNDLSGVISRNFKVGDSSFAVPFGYAYLRDDMDDMDANYSSLSLFPTAHAHSGQVIVAGVTFTQPIVDYHKYLLRCSYANIWKNEYVYSRERFWEHDPYRHDMRFSLRNRPVKSVVIDDQVQFVDIDDSELPYLQPFRNIVHSVPLGTPVFRDDDATSMYDMKTNIDDLEEGLEDEIDEDDHESVAKFDQAEVIKAKLTAAKDRNIVLEDKRKNKDLADKLSLEPEIDDEGLVDVKPDMFAVSKRVIKKKKKEKVINDLPSYKSLIFPKFIIY
jgi:hypothetical protein